MDNVDDFIYQHIPEIVSAVGGYVDEVYELGDEGIGCLADIKKWLLNYDMKSNKWETAHAISKTTFVETDLVPILAEFERESVPERAALMALEITTHLTWPLEINPTIHTKKHQSQLADLVAAQARYKQAVVTHSSHRVLRGAASLALPHLAKPSSERNQRENSIINIVVNFMRNLLAITPEDRSPLFIELENQNMFEFLVLLASRNESITPKQAIPILEVLWGVVNGIDATKLYTGSAEFKITDLSLEELLEKEKKMRNARFKPTRHSRFGSLITLDIDGGGNNTFMVSGQRALGKDYLEAIGEGKNWRKSRVRNTGASEKVAWGRSTSLQPEAAGTLKNFVSQFLDTCFNTFYIRTKGFVSGLAGEFDNKQVMHYVYTLGWFANAERLRSKAPDFKLIGTALSYSMFTVVCDLMGNSSTGPVLDYDMVFAGMVTLRGILTIVDDMTRSGPEWKDAAENIMSRLFYDEVRLDYFATIPQFANRRSPEFQGEAIELIHAIFRLLDFYASDKAVIFVRSKRAGTRDEDEDEENGQDASHNKVRERKWDVNRYIKKYYKDATIDLYQNAVLSYRETDYKVLKHSLAFLHRLFIKKEMRCLFFRLPFMQGLLKATSSVNGIQNPELLKGYYKFTSFYTKELFKCAEKNPSIFIELLFRKSRYDVDFYDLGLLQETKVPKKALEFEYEFTDPSLSKDQKIGICVAALNEDNHRSTVEWILEAIKEHVRLQEQETKLRPFVESSARLKELSSLAMARCLTKVMGFKTEPTAGRYFVPASLGAFELIEISEVIEKALEGIEEDPHNFLRRTMNDQQDTEEHAEETSQSGGGGLFVGDSSEDEAGFDDPRLQPLSAEELAAKQLEIHRKPVKTPKKAASKRRQATIDDSESESESESDSERKKRKTLAPAIEQKLFKSSAFVHASDDEDDEERDRLFFEREVQRAKERGLMLDEVAANQDLDTLISADNVQEDELDPEQGEESSDRLLPAGQSTLASDNEQDLFVQ